MKIKIYKCEELILPISLKKTVDSINQLTAQCLHSVQNDHLDFDPKVLSKLDSITNTFYTRLANYIEDPKLYDLHGYYLYKFNGKRNVLKHPSYKLKFS